MSEKQFDGLQAASGVVLIDPAELAWAEAFNKAVERARQELKQREEADGSN